MRSMELFREDSVFYRYVKQMAQSIGYLTINTVLQHAQQRAHFLVTENQETSTGA